MLFIFPPAIQAGLAAGKFVQVISSAGVPLSIARDAATGRFVGHAVGAVVSNSPLSLLGTAAQMVQTHAGFQGTYGRLDVIQAGVQTLQNSVGILQATTAVQPILSAAQMYQTHRGFTAVLNNLSAIQASLGVLQATTAVIGVGVAAGVALSAVNFHQTLKLREDVKQLRLEVKSGFIDLKKALKAQGTEIIQRIDEVAQDIKFEQHRLVLIQAYGRFLEATKLMKIAMSCEDMSIRNADLANARQMLAEALADYNNPRLLSETSAAGQLRRLECAWAIEQTIALSYTISLKFGYR